jgi:hypothetical protein
MNTELKSFLISKGLPGETVGDLAARFATDYATLADANGFRSSGDSVAGKLVTMPWSSFADDVASTPLGKLVLAHENEALAVLGKELASTEAPVRISHTPFQWDFAALSTIVSFSVSKDAAMLMTAEGVGAVERLESVDLKGLERMLARLCGVLAEALAEHRSESARARA